MSAIVKFAFQGDELDVVRTEDGDVAVPLRRLCEVLGVDADTQAKKLRTAPWSVTVMMTVTASDGKGYDTTCLSRRSIPMWAASISPSKVRPELREKLVAYQRECADVLADHFLGKRGEPRPRFEEAAETFVQQSVLVGDDLNVQARMRTAIRRVMLATSQSWQKVEGIVRRSANAPGWKRVAVFNAARIIDLLESIEMGVVALPPRKVKLRVIEGGRQLTMFDILSPSHPRLVRPRAPGVQ